MSNQDDRAPTMDRRGITRLAPADHAMIAWQERGTLEQWRAADELLRREAGTPVGEAHERAVAIALDGLERFHSVESLVAHWRRDRYRRLGDYGDPPAGTVESWVRDACCPEEGCTPPNEEIVAGAALWRRARELMEN
jgi:hypothetical protein